jgi:hypothetical protein
MAMIAKCPSCGKKYNVDDGKAGRAAKCSCGNRFVVGQEDGADLLEVASVPQAAPDPAGLSPSRDARPDPLSPFARPRSVVCAYPEKGPAGKIIAWCVVAAVVIVAVVLVWKFVVAPNSKDASSNVSSHKSDLTVEEFQDRIGWRKALMVRHDLAAFTAMVGEPERVVKLGLDVHLYYACKDGRLHVTANKAAYAQNVVFITTITAE